MYLHADFAVIRDHRFLVDSGVSWSRAQGEVGGGAEVYRGARGGPKWLEKSPHLAFKKSDIFAGCVFFSGRVYFFSGMCIFFRVSSSDQKYKKIQTSPKG